MDKPKHNAKVIVFSSPTCPPCSALKHYLREKQVRFREINIDRDIDAARDLARRGFRSVPTTFINNRPVVGFDKAKINRLLGIH